MTDEELAEKYADKAFGLYYPTDQERYQVTEAFLAGLKAGRPKWHNFRENRNDLPPLREGSDRASIKVVDESDRCIVYDYGSKCWRSYTGDRLGVQPDFWCEIPEYTEE